MEPIATWFVLGGVILLVLFVARDWHVRAEGEARRRNALSPTERILEDEHRAHEIRRQAEADAQSAREKVEGDAEFEKKVVENIECWSVYARANPSKYAQLQWDNRDVSHFEAKKVCPMKSVGEKASWWLGWLWQ